MKKRYLAEDIRDLCFGTGKMAFVSGPRQCGKTTLAKGIQVVMRSIWEKHDIAGKKLLVVGAAEFLGYLP